MARKLNKNVVGILTMVGMLLLAVIGIVLLQSLPGQDPKVYEAEARKLEQAQEHYRAMRTYHRAYLRDSDRNPKYLVMAARCALEDGNIGGARDLLAQALVRDSELRSALELSTELELELAKLFRGEAQWNRVLETANKLLANDGQSSAAHFALGLAYAQRRRDDPSYKEKGEKSLKRALELDPTNVDVIGSATAQLWASAREQEAEDNTASASAFRERATATLAAAIERCERLGEKAKVSELRQLQAWYMILGGSVEEGLADLEEVVQGETERADGHILLATLHISGVPRILQPDHEKAEAVATAGLEVDPKSWQLYQLLGRIRRSQNKFEEEAVLYRRALDEIHHEKHFRSFAENRFRVSCFTELFLQDIRRATEAEQGSDDTEHTKMLAAAEAWIEKLKDEVHEDSLDVRFLRAHLHQAKGDVIAAIREAEVASRMVQADQHAGLQRLLANLYIGRREWGAARRALETAIMRERGSPSLRVQLGQVLLYLGQPADALKILKPNTAGLMREYLDGNPLARRLRAEAYRQLGQFDLALAESEGLDQGTPEAELQQAGILLSEGRADEAEQKIRAVLEQDSEHAGASQALINLYGRTGKLAEARSFVDAQLAKDPDNRLYQRWRVVLMDEGDTASKDETILKFLKEEKDPFQRALSLADYFLSRGKHEEAAKHLDEAEGLEPTSADAIERQFRTSVQLQDWDRAEKYARRHGALNIDGTEGKVAQGRLALARGLAARADGDEETARELVGQATELIKAGLEQYPVYSLGWTFLAQSHLAAGRISEAKDTLLRALDIDPTNGFANKGMAEISSGEGNQEAAQMYLEAAARFLPNDPQVIRSYQLLKERENPREGIASREEVRSNNPKDLENLVLLARLYALPSVGDYEEAANIYKEAIEVSGDDPGLAREVAGFFGRQDVNRPAEGEALLERLLEAEEDDKKKATLAVHMGQFYQSQGELVTADRHFRLAVHLDPSPQILVFAAEFYTGINRTRDALEYYGRALSQSEGDIELAKLMRSRTIGLLLARGDLAEAKQNIDDFRRRYPDDAQGMVFEGAYHRMGGDIEKAKQAFDAHLEKNPDSALALWQRGQLHILMGRWRSAIEDLRRAKVFKSDAFGYQHRIALADALVEIDQDDEAVTELRSILDEHPDQEGVAEALIDVYQRASPPRYLDAENLVHIYIRKDPNNLKWPLLLGRLGETCRDWDMAVRGYEAAAHLRPTRRDIVAALLGAHKEAGRPQDIIDFVGQKLSRSLLESTPEALASLAWAHSKLGDNDKCLEAYDDALASAKDSFGKQIRIVREMCDVFGKDVVLERALAQSEAAPEDIERHQALVHLLFLNGKHEEAIDACRRISELAVRDTEKIFAAMAEGMLLESLDRFAEAKEKYEEALKLDAQQPVALNNLAFLLAEKLDNAAEALPYAEEANRLQPNNPDVLDTLGWALFKNQRDGEAAGMLLRAIEIDRNNVAAAYHLGMVHMKRGEFDEARIRLEAARDAAGHQNKADILEEIDDAIMALGKKGY